MQSRLPDGRLAQDDLRAEGRRRTPRGIPVLLLYYQRAEDADPGSGLPGQPALRPGKPDRAVEERRAGATQPGGQPVQQLGLHGDGEPGVDAQGMVRAAAAHARRPLACEIPDRAAGIAEDGVQAVREQPDPTAVPDRANGQEDRLPAVVVEPVGRGAAAAERGDAQAADLLRKQTLTSG